MNIERHARRHLFGRPQKALLYPAPGCRDALAEELQHLVDRLQTPGGARPALKTLREALVIEGADFRTLLEIAMRITTAQDMTLVVADGSVHNRKGLNRLLDGVAWELFLAPGDRVSLRAESFDSSLYHEGIIRDCVRERLDAIGVLPDAEAETGTHRVRIHLVRDICRVELSLVGEPLWKRGYRAELSATAPLREDLAQSAIRMALAEAPRDPIPPSLFVPFVGSGTLLFEYLIALFEIPPFVFREEYAFERFACGVPPSVGWVRRRLSEELAGRLKGEGRGRVWLLDSEPAAIESTKANLHRFTDAVASADLDGSPQGSKPLDLDLDLTCADVFSKPWSEWLSGLLGASVQDPGDLFLPLNPPYGIRLPTSSTEELYGRIGQGCHHLSESLRPGRLSGFVLCPTESSWSRFMKGATGLAFKTSHLTHGGIDVRLCRFQSA
jgi:23S rRNA G2445 N2-methylase RlmL